MQKHILLLALSLLISVAALAQQADLEVQKTGSTSVPAFSDVAYTVTISNSGPDVAADVTLTDLVPAGMSFVSRTQDSGPAFTCDNTVTCTIASLAVGQSATFTFTYHIDQGSAENVATATSSTPDPNSANNESSVTTTTQPTADLLVQKTGPATAPDDSDVSYDVTITNLGTDDATNVTLTDVVPSGMAYVSATQNDGPTFACDTNVTCTIATLPAGQSANFTFVFHIEEGSEFTNIATASAQTADLNPENNSAVAVTTVGAMTADMFVQKNGPAAVAPDTDVAFQITLGNAGPAAATDVLLTDNLPGGLTFVSFVQNTGPTMSCGTSTCSLASFPAGTTATFTLTGHVPAGTPAGTEFTNTAVVESQNDPLEENNSGTTTVVVSSSDVSIVKTGPPAAVAGETISYSITVTNNGPDFALNVTVQEPALCAVQNCVIGGMAPGASQVFNFDVDIPSDATMWSNTATVTTDSADPNAMNNSSTVNTTITQEADLEVVKTGPASAVAGTDITYTVTVTNNGPSDASNVSLTETTPAGTTFVSSSCNATVCDFPTITAGDFVELTFVFHVGANTTAAFTNTATATTSTTDTNGANNSDSVDTTVTQSADLVVVKTGPGSADVDTDITYTVTVTNNGPSDASNVSVTETTPASTTFVTSTCGTTTCNVGTLAAGASSVLTFVFHVDPNATGPIVNTATGTSSTADPDNENNESTATTTIEPADVTITKTADPEVALPGMNVTYTIVVTNNGPGTATGVVVTDTLPAGTTLVSSSAGCTGTTTITCTIGTMLAGASSTIELEVTMPSTPGTVSNTASVDSSSADPTAGNDASTAPVNVAAATPAIPTLSPLALMLLAAVLASIVVVVLRR